MRNNAFESKKPGRAYYLAPVVLLSVVAINLFLNKETIEEKKDTPIFLGYTEEYQSSNFSTEEIMQESNSQFIDMESYLLLINKNNALSAEYAPSDLRLVQVLDNGNNPNTTIYLRERVATMAEDMFEAAESDGLLLLARSGYRGYETQEKLYQRYVEAYGETEAARFSARPGHSEHQTGLALDLTSNTIEGQIDVEFSNTPEGTWVKENAHRFGFIIRYPEGKEEKTGYMYEPWHLRYVGINTATIIHQNNWTLEDYIENQ